ncbi:MAG: hypothetical protein ACSLFE_03785 [Gemmatimonadaceae bacterium]
MAKYIAKLLSRIWQVFVRWFTEDVCTIADPIERKKRDDRKAREKAIATEKARLQAMLDSGRYELVAVWRTVKTRAGRFPWHWRRSGSAMRAISPRRRRARRILAEHGVNYKSGRQRRRFRKTFNRAYRASVAGYVDVVGPKLTDELVDSGLVRNELQAAA